MKAAVLKELAEGERRVAAVPATVEKMVKAGMEVCLESEAGLASGFQDGEYREAGARVEPSRDGALDGAAAVLKVQKPSGDELDRIPEGWNRPRVIGLLEISDAQRVIRMSAAGIDAHRAFQQVGRLRVILVEQQGAAA